MKQGCTKSKIEIELIELRDLHIQIYSMARQLESWRGIRAANYNFCNGGRSSNTKDTGDVVVKIMQMEESLQQAIEELAAKEP